MEENTCQICGQTTFRVSEEYMIGQNHLKCELERQNLSPKPENV